MSEQQHREFVCDLDDILDGAGVCALVDDEQVAIFRVGDALFALENLDPFSGANVLARGLVGDLKGELVVASPVYKQHFGLKDGRCVEDEAVALRTWNCGVLDGRVWVESRRVPSRLAAVAGRRRLVVVGNGMAAMRTVEELMAEAPGMYDITVFGSEPRGNYNRILLSPLLAGEKQWSDIESHPLEWYERNGIRLHAGETVTRIDRRQRRVIAASGIVAHYDRLLLATGSDPVRLDVPGSALGGITAFRSLDDVDAMLGAARESRRAVVIGGGLLGLEAASGLRAQGMDVTVVHINGRIMDRQLDAQAARLLQASLEARGIAFCLGGRTSGFEGSDGRVAAVLIGDGRRLPADLVVIAAGIRPRVELARSCGLRCDRGILVDDTLQTFDPAIYAVGECVQHRGSTYGLVAPLWEQARVCAAHLAEHGGTRYRGSLPSASLKVTGIELFSAGDIEAGASSETLRFADPARGIYKRLLVEQGRLRGVVLYGDTQDAGWYAELIETGRDVSALREHMLLGGSQLQQRQA